MRIFFKNWAVVLALTFAVTSVASADPLTIRATLDSIYGQSVSYSLGGSNKSTTAGRFNWERKTDNPGTAFNEAGTFPLDPVPSGDMFYSFCIDLTQTVGVGGTYEWEVEEDLSKGRDSNNYPELGTTIAANITKFLGAIFPSLTGNLTTVEAAAIQIVLWELIYEDPSNSFDTTSGHFKSSTATVTASANTMLATFASYNGAGAEGLLALNNANKQDQLIQIPGSPDTEVPEPATFALMGVGLLAVGAFRRKFAR